MKKTINETAICQAMDFVKANESAASFARQLLFTLQGDKKAAKAAIKIAVCRLHLMPETTAMMLAGGYPNGLVGKAYATACRALDRFTAPEKAATAPAEEAATAPAEEAATAPAEVKTEELSGVYAALNLLNVHFTGHDHEQKAFELLEALTALL